MTREHAMTGEQAFDGALLAELRQLHRSEIASSALRERILGRVASLPEPEPLRRLPLAAGLLAAVALLALFLLLPRRQAEPASSAVAVSPAVVSPSSVSAPVASARKLAPAGSAVTGAPAAELCPLAQVPPGALYDPSFVEFNLTREGLALGTFEMQVPGCGALTRRYFWYRAPGLPVASRVPLLIVLHDSGDSAEGMRALQAQRSFETLADREHLLVIYANAGPGPSTSRFPNSGGWQTDPGANRALDDEGYLERISSDLRERGVIEGSNEVYLVGYAGGGVMALEAAARHPERYSGVAALLPPRLRQLRPEPRQSGARLSRILFVTLASDRPDYYWPGKPLDPALLQDWELTVGLPRKNEGIPGTAGAHPPTRSIALPGRSSDVQQFDFTGAASGAAAVRVLVVPEGDELSVGAGGGAAPLDIADRAWEFLRGVGNRGP